ncbi:MAG: DUF167 domain-containing protein [Candidatus Omnitrophota bacterium]
MKIKVRVIPRAKKRRVEVFTRGLKIYLNSPAIEDRANKELIEILSDYYNIKKYNIAIVKGKKQRNKIVQISEIS